MGSRARIPGSSALSTQVSFSEILPDGVARLMVSRSLSLLSGPYIGSFACGCWLSDPLNSFFGRRGTIFVTALILIATPIASGFTQSWQTLFVVRLISACSHSALSPALLNTDCFLP